jgi:hypothetical protein
VSLVVVVLHVKSGNVHASVKHFDEHLNVPAGWSESTNDFGPSDAGVSGFENLGELNFGGVVFFLHHFVV